MAGQISRARTTGGEFLSTPKVKSKMTQQAFDGLLDWLDSSDRELAGKKYEETRQNLIKIFLRRGFQEAEDLADTVVDRVARKLPDIVQSYKGDPALYFYGVARKVQSEFKRQRRDANLGLLPPPADDIEQIYACLEKCLDGNSGKNKELILEYFQKDKSAKINNRKHLSNRLGIPLNTLRTRAHRIKLRLRQCIDACMRGK